MNLLWSGGDGSHPESDPGAGGGSAGGAGGGGGDGGGACLTYEGLRVA